MSLLGPLFSTFRPIPTGSSGSRANSQFLTSRSRDDSPDATNTSSENDENAPKEKKSFFGFRKTNKIEKAKNIPEAIGRILNIPKDKIIVNNKAYADKKEKEKREKEATDKFNQYLNETDNETSDENQTNDFNTDSSSDPSDSSSAVSQSTTGPSDNSDESTTPSESKTPSESTTQGESSSKKSSKAVPIISSYQFDPSIGEEQQTQIKGVIGSLNTMLRLPELGLFADDEIEGKTDSVVMVEKIIDDDGEKQNPPKEIYIEPLIQIVE